MTFEIYFLIANGAFTIFLSYLWRSDSLLNNLFKASLFLLGMTSLFLVAQKLGYIIKI